MCVYILLMWCITVGTIMARNSMVHMTDGGILVIHDPRPLNILSDNIIITLKLDTTILQRKFSEIHSTFKKSKRHSRKKCSSRRTDY